MSRWLTNHQSAIQLRAAIKQGSIERSVVWNPRPEMVERVKSLAEEIGIDSEAGAVTQKLLCLTGQA